MSSSMDILRQGIEFNNNYRSLRAGVLYARRATRGKRSWGLDRIPYLEKVPGFFEICMGYLEKRKGGIRSEEASKLGILYLEFIDTLPRVAEMAKDRKKKKVNELIERLEEDKEREKAEALKL